tara:strand:- start:7 stop:600 length:594 start_codon:yes stop_codon:yes gene_type:complete
MQVIDGFFRNPYSIRSLALKQEYGRTAHIDYNWPGYRSLIDETLENQYLEIMKKRVNDSTLQLQQIYFQWIPAEWVQGCFHTDPCKYTAVTFLTPDPPSNTGTEIGEVKREYTLDLEDNFSKSSKQPFYRMNKKGFFYRNIFKIVSQRYNSKFKNPCAISNKFNRTVFFDAPRTHRAQNFFGKELKDSRLTLVGFFS